MPIAENFTSIFSHERRIDFTQCLPSGYLRLTDLCNLLQLTAADHADSGGISFTDMQCHEQAWVLSRMRVEIARLPLWRDEVTVSTWIVSLEASRSVRALEVYAGGEKIVGCETFWAVFNTRTRRPEALALPHAHFEKFAGRFATEQRTRKIITGERLHAVATHEVVLSDLDVVNHANNVKYLEWCLDRMDARAVLGGRIKSLDMNFLSELTLGDRVTIAKSEEEDATVFAILKDDKPCFALAVGH